MFQRLFKIQIWTGILVVLPLCCYHCLVSVSHSQNIHNQQKSCPAQPFPS
jgi:hypothetical protein